ncbi:hypothetical protein [Leptospira weilii]|uniref:hypothetical protein n=1 Tax=Leptospira weilii TaxID=28184 RepID=UPI001F2D6CDE|nr:hypothetical protein [Leptospira weilii]
MVRIQFLILFLFLTTLACSPKEENPLTKPFSIDKDTSLLLLLLQIDRFENYDQDVEILTHTNIPPYSGKSNFSVDLNYEGDDLKLYLEFLKQEIQKYPRGYMIKARASKLVVVHDVLQSQSVRSSLSGLADPTQNIIYLSTLGFKNCLTYNWTYNNETCLDEYRYVIHHELNHNIDYTIRHYSFNRDWHALNPPGFQYGAPLYDANGEPVITWARPGFSNPVPGFVDFYSTSNYAEEYAQIGSGVFGYRQAKLMDICQKDPIVNAKVKFIYRGNTTILAVSVQKRRYVLESEDGPRLYRLSLRLESHSPFS